MSYVNPKRQRHARQGAKSLVRDAIQSDARIYAIMAEDPAECERSIEYKFSRAESKEIFRFIRDNILNVDPA